MIWRVVAEDYEKASEKRDLGSRVQAQEDCGSPGC